MTLAFIAPEPSSPPRFWAVIPCAGVGARAMAAGALEPSLPKQYQPLLGQPLVLHTLAAFAAVPQLAGTLVAVASGDDFLAAYPSSRYFTVPCGGPSRAQTVLGALRALLQRGAQADDWVLVHDAARPNLARSDLDRLLTELADDPVGGLLAVPVRDTLKRADANGRVAQTVDRSQIWQAYTPQMFRFGALQRALAEALVADVAVTDEASAIEWAGQAPRLIEGRADNLKVTRPEDLDWLRLRWGHKY